MEYGSSIRTGLAALASVSLLVASGAMAESAEGEQADYTEMSAKELANHLIFEKEGFDLDEETQEGGTVRDRLKQDELQKTCSALEGENVDSETADKVREMARENMEYPEGGIELGDWERGQEIAENAFGFRVGHKVDDHSEEETGGMCINCHEMESAKSHRSGTIGPSLVNYGKDRGSGESMVRFAYEMIYNPHVNFPCTKMPRLGANGILDKEKIQHVLGYLFDPESPVNQ